MPVIGTAANQLSTNQDLGRLAFQDPNGLVIEPTANANPAGIGNLVFELTNDTTLKIKVKGSDGTVRTNTLTLA